MGNLIPIILKNNKGGLSNVQIEKENLLEQLRTPGEDGGKFLPGRVEEDGTISRSMVSFHVTRVDSRFKQGIHEALQPYEYFWYSTMDHGPNSPDLYLVLPICEFPTQERKKGELNRNELSSISKECFTNSVQYEPVARVIAETIGIGAVEETSFAHDYFMAFPTDQNPTYEFFHHVGPRVYSRDYAIESISSINEFGDWPKSHESFRELEKQSVEALQREDTQPLEKLFNAAYSVANAIEVFLPGVFYPGMGDNQFTFTGGTLQSSETVHKFSLFSRDTDNPFHHSLLTAFDLVRLHKYLSLGEKESYEAMVSLMDSRPEFSDTKEIGWPTTEEAINDRMIKAQVLFSEFQSKIEAQAVNHG
jgi:putative DNA primase/helicase